VASSGGSDQLLEGAFAPRRLVDELEEARVGAISTEQFSAATSASVAKAKLTGKMIDRVEHGAPADFSACQTTEEVFAKLLTDIGDPREAVVLLDVMRERLVEAISAEAVPIEAVLPVRRLTRFGPASR
jgi:hypothetical protein